MIVLFWILGQVSAYFAMLFSYKRKDYIKTIFLSEGVYYAVYAIASGILMWIRKYSVKKAVFLTLLLFIICSLILFLVERKREREVVPVKESLRNYIPLLVLLIPVFFLSTQKAGFHDMSQDSGIYTARALFYVYDYNDTVVSFPEANKLFQEFEKAAYRQKINDIHCFNPDWYYEADATDKFYQTPGGVIYGMPVFSSLLALWGKIFGIGHMVDLLTLLYMLSVAFVYIALIHKKNVWWQSLLLSALYAVCPVLIWCSCQTLTEISLSMFAALFVALVTETDKEWITVLSALPIVAFMFIHIAGFFLVPCFVLLYFILFFVTGQKKELVALFILLPGLVAAFFSGGDIATFYFEEHFELLYNYLKGRINPQNVRSLVLMVSAGCLLVAAICLAVPVRKKKTDKKERSLFAEISAVLFLLMMAGVIVLGIWRTLKAGDKQLMQDSVMHFVTGIGYVTLPLAFLGIFFGRKEKDCRKEVILLSYIIPYCLLIYCVILYGDIRFYYYYARYFVFIYPFVFVAAGLFTRKMKFYILAPLIIFCGGFTLVTNPLLLKDQDKTYFSYDNLEAVYACIEDDLSLTETEKEKAAVLIFDSGYEEKGLFTLPIKAGLQMDVYFFDTELTDYQMAEMSMLYEQIYMITAAYDRFVNPTGDDVNWITLATVENALCYYNETGTKNAVYMPVEATVIPNRYLVLRRSFK